MFRVDVMFKGMDNIDQLFRIGEVMGSAAIEEYVNKYVLKPDARIREWIYR